MPSQRLPQLLAAPVTHCCCRQLLLVLLWLPWRQQGLAARLQWLLCAVKAPE
jgi:hypothetical protein